MTKKEEVGISGIILAIGKKEITLTPEEARDLYKALHIMYGEKIRTEFIPQYVPTPRPWWNYPIYSSSSCGNISLLAKNQEDDFKGSLLELAEKKSF